jgi:hypothetical protein
MKLGFETEAREFDEYCGVAVDLCPPTKHANRRAHGCVGITSHPGSADIRHDNNPVLNISVSSTFVLLLSHHPSSLPSLRSVAVARITHRLACVNGRFPSRRRETYLSTGTARYIHCIETSHPIRKCRTSYRIATRLQSVRRSESEEDLSSNNRSGSLRDSSAALSCTSI